MSYKRDSITSPRYMWCPTCKKHILPYKGNQCPECGMISDTCKCTRCGYVWKPRLGCDPGPEQCYSCHTYLYDRMPKNSNVKKKR